MKIHLGEKVIYREPMSAECHAEIEKTHGELEIAKREALVLQNRIDMLKSKADFLNKQKWVMVDTLHPATEINNFPDNVCRRIDMEGKEILIIEGCEDHGSVLREIHVHGMDGLGGLGEILAAALKGRKPKEPKEPAPAAAEPAPAG